MNVVPIPSRWRLAVLLVAIVALPIGQAAAPAALGIISAAFASDAAPYRAPESDGPQAQARNERPVPFKAGEVLTYDVSWSTYLTAGTLIVSVREKRPSFGSVAYYVTGEGRPTPLLSKLYSLYYKADTLVDVYTLLPQRGSTYSEESGRRRMKITRFNHAARTVEFEMQTATVFKKELAVPPYAQDILSALVVIRALPLKTGAKLTMPVCDGGDLYRAIIVVGAREMVRTGLGTVNALKIVPTVTDAKGRPAVRGMALWISDDARRLPVKLQAELAVGSFVVVLRDAKG